MDRQNFVRQLALRIAAIDLQHPVRVAIDGVDAAGKTTLADELAPAVAGLGRPVIRASIDGFHNPQATRRRRGSTSPEGYFHDSFNYPALVEGLLEPLGPRGSRRFRRAVFDFRSDRVVDAPVETAGLNSVLIFDGVFLLRPELRENFDFSVFLKADFSVTVDRAALRDIELFGSAEEVRHRYVHRYVPGQQLYLASARPDRAASLVVNNNDPLRPKIEQARPKDGSEAPASFDEDKIRDVLRAAWSIDSSTKWTADRPSLGQCSPTALVIHDWFGGSLLKTSVHGARHFYNWVGERAWDFTAEQFEVEPHYEHHEATRDEALLDCTPLQYFALAERFQLAWTGATPRPLSRPPFTRAFCVGQAKSGTASLCGLLSGAYRAVHEPERAEVLSIILREARGEITSEDVRAWLVERDARLALEYDIAWANQFLVGHLRDVFPETRFVVLIRDPYTWLGSVAGHLLSRDIPSEVRTFLDWWFRPNEYPPGPGDEALVGTGLYSVDAFLAAWNRHLETCRAALPATRTLTLRTHELHRSHARLAEFLGIPADTLSVEQGHLNQRTWTGRLEDLVSLEHLESSVERLCADNLRRYFPEIRGLKDAMAL